VRNLEAFSVLKEFPMAVVIPDATLHATHLTATEMKQELAIMLFEQDRLTLAQAAALAEIRLLPFQHLLASRGIPPHYDVAEYEQDVATLQGLGRLE
jgi:predicted HTH domain antitoxin